MKKIEQIFENITKLKVKSLKLLPTGLTNNDYLVKTVNKQIFVLRLPKKFNKKLFNYENEEKVIKSVSKLNLDVNTYYFDNKTGIKITNFVPNLKSFSKSKMILNKKLKLVADGINKIHGVNIDKSIIFNPFVKLNSYKKEINKIIFKDENIIINECLNQFKKTRLVTSHNDIVDGNLLFSDKRLYIIDYEYAGYNHPMFDLASFLSENNIENKKDINKFLKFYYKKNYSTVLLNQVMIWYRFNDLLWSYWAFMMYSKEHKKVYKDIYKQKSKRYEKLK